METEEVPLLGTMQSNTEASHDGTISDEFSNGRRDDDIDDSSLNDSPGAPAKNRDLDFDFVADFGRLQRERDAAMAQNRQLLEQNQEMQRQITALTAEISTLNGNMAMLLRRQENAECDSPRPNVEQDAMQPTADDPNADDEDCGTTRRTSQFKKRKITRRILHNNMIFPNINCTATVRRHLEKTKSRQGDTTVNENGDIIRTNDANGETVNLVTTGRALGGDDVIRHSIMGDSSISTGGSAASIPMDIGAPAASSTPNAGGSPTAIGDHNYVRINDTSNPNTPAAGPTAIGVKLRGKSWADALRGGTSDRVNGERVAAGAEPLKTLRPTPIQLAKATRAEYDEILTGLRSKFGPGSFQWHELGTGGAPRVFANTMSTKAGMMTWLKHADVQFNTYAQSSLRRKSYLIRGLAAGDDNENRVSIIGALRNAGIAGDIVVSAFVTGYMRRNLDKHHAKLYRCTLDHDTSDTVISGITAIGDFRVRFENMRKSKVIQCKRFQRFSHTAALCAYNYRCVQFIQQHQPGQCPRVNDPSITLGCVNCMAAGLEHVGHTSNDLRNCGYHIKRTQKSDDKGTQETGGGVRVAMKRAPDASSIVDVPAIAETRHTVRSAVAGDNKNVATNTARHTILQRADIVEAVRANNPHVKSGPKPKNIPKTKGGRVDGNNNGNTPNRKSGPTAGNINVGTGSGSVGGSGGDNMGRDNGIGDLIRLLTQVLNQFTAQKCQ